MMLSKQSLLVLGGMLALIHAAPACEPDIANAPALPSSNLPPPTGLTLKVITLGVGHQNYTCNATTGTYGSNVAIADLYDATRYLSKHKHKVSTISEDRLQQYKDAGECAEDSDYNPRLKQIGEHYFQSTTPPTPVFDLYELDLFLEAKKASGVPAPDTADNIDWLYLVDNGMGETKGLKAVYRVETAGGRPPATCSGSEKVSVPYVAQYWFYD